jgi:hypothetical protein
MGKEGWLVLAFTKLILMSRFVRSFEARFARTSG